MARRGLIRQYLSKLPEKDRTHHQYMMWYRVENDDNRAWAYEEPRELRPDDIEYPKLSPFVSLSGLLP